MYRPPQRIRHNLPGPTWPTKSQAEVSTLFSPIKLGKTSASGRSWVPAMVPWRATASGEVTQDVLDWYQRFAKGKPAVMVVEATGVGDIPSGPLLRINRDECIEGLSQIASVVREASGGETKLLIQLIDFLPIKRRVTAEKFLTRYLKWTHSHQQRIEPYLVSGETAKELLLRMPELCDVVLTKRELEDMRYGYRQRVTDVDDSYVRELPVRLPELFAQAAKRAVAAGFDGVEVHAAHAYTLASFLSGENSRTDGYGSHRNGRLKLPLAVLEAVRKACDKAIVGIRMLAEEKIRNGIALDDAKFYAEHFAKAGADYISLSTGGKFEDAKQPKVGRAAYPYTGPSGYECMPSVFSDEKGPFGRNLVAMAEIRKHLRARGLSIPTVASGGLCDFQQMEQLLTAGHADFVASARQTLADPDWFQKMKRGLGDTIRRCDFTNYCEALDQKHEKVTCKKWDRLADSVVPVDKLTGRKLTAP